MQVLAKKFTGQVLPKEMREAIKKLTSPNNCNLILPRDLKDSTLERTVDNLRITVRGLASNRDEDSKDEIGDDESYLERTRRKH